MPKSARESRPCDDQESRRGHRDAQLQHRHLADDDLHQRADRRDPRPLSAIRSLLHVLNPFAPHLTEELWERLHDRFDDRPRGPLADLPWPEFDPALLIEDEVEMPVQVNGKVRDKIVVKKDASVAEIEAIARAAPKVVEHTSGKTIRKVVVVPGRLVNIVVVDERPRSGGASSTRLPGSISSHRPDRFHDFPHPYTRSSCGATVDSIAQAPFWMHGVMVVVLQSTVATRRAHLKRGNPRVRRRDSAESAGLRCMRPLRGVTSRRRGNPAQFRDHPFHDLERGRHLRGCIETPKGKSKARSRALIGAAHRFEHVRGVDGAGGAGAAGRATDALLIEQHQHGFGIDAVERKIRRVRQPMCRSPLICAPEIRSSSAFSNWSRIARTSVSSCSINVPASSHALPSPTMLATFCVPARRPFSCPPPVINGANRVRRLT